MSVHPSSRDLIRLLRSSSSSQRNDEVVEFSGTGNPSGSTVHGQSLASGQSAVYYREDWHSPADAVWVTSDGGTSWVRPDSGIDAVRIFDDFHYQAGFTEVDGPWILNSGADAQAVDPAATGTGALRLTTGDADGTVANDGSQVVCAIPVQAGYGGLYMEARVRINTAITDISVNIGLTDSTSLEEPFAIGGSDAVTSTASDAACFCYDTGADTDEWFMLAVDSDTEDTGNATTGTAPVADTFQTFRIEVEADGATIRFYIDGTLEGTLSGDAGVSPDVDLYATIIANATTTTSKTVDVDYVEVGSLRG